MENEQQYNSDDFTPAHPVGTAQALEGIPALSDDAAFRLESGGEDELTF